MTALNFRQLIDLAIGTPEPGHVNFQALHCLLYSFAEELNIIDKNVDCAKYTNINLSMIHGEKSGEEGATAGAAGATTEAAAAAAEEGATAEAEKTVDARSEMVKKSEAAHLPKDADATTKDETVKESLDHFEHRLSAVEVESGTISAELNKGLSIMREQLELTMDQVQALTKLTLSSNEQAKIAPRQLEKLRTKSARLQTAQIHNPYIISLHLVTNEEAGSLRSSEQVSEEQGQEEEEVEVSRNSSQKFVPLTEQDRTENDNFDMDLHLCYSPEKLLDQLLELKSEFCLLSNKVNDISATLLEQDCQHIMQVVQELQHQIVESKTFATTLKELMDIMESRQNSSIVNIDLIHKTLRDLTEDKIDKGEIGVLLANKVDYKQLQHKVSHEQIQEIKCQLERQFCEIHNLMGANEKNMEKLINDLRISLGYDSIEGILKKFKEKIEQDMTALQDTLQKYIDSTNDECAAAGARMKVLQDLACISCDTTCVMRTIEKSKVGKLPGAHATPLLSPLITYELGSIRKSGLMGYYRKDEFPHAPNAWMNRQVPLKACVPRHAGGSHTTFTAKERVEKVLLNKK